VYDRGEWNGTHYIAMEYVPGRSLKAIIREQAPFAPGRAVDVAVQLLRAAEFVHSRGIVHRDLKPDNAIVDDDGCLKVTDFGIARSGDSDITQTGVIVGTTQYVSPEQAEGRAVSVASDLYSIGIILYELLTGSVPFDGESIVATLLKHVNERPAPPSARNAGVSLELDAIVMRALEKDPASRFATADAFIAALEHAKTNLEASNRADGAGVQHDVRPVDDYEQPVETPRSRRLRRARLPAIPTVPQLARLRIARAVAPRGARACR
jgi:serine/threonine-protein kinase